MCNSKAKRFAGKLLGVAQQEQYLHLVKNSKSFDFSFQFQKIMKLLNGL